MTIGLRKWRKLQTRSRSERGLGSAHGPSGNRRGSWNDAADTFHGNLIDGGRVDASEIR